MSAPYTGRCVCGAVTLKIAGEAIMTRQCWCRQCQQIAAGGPTQNATFQSDDVVASGSLATTTWFAASGNLLTLSFCPECGTHIYAQSSARIHLKTVRLGAIDEPHGLKPSIAIWTEEAPDWAKIDPAMEQWPQYPPPPPGAS